MEAQESELHEVQGQTTTLKFFQSQSLMGQTNMIGNQNTQLHLNTQVVFPLPSVLSIAVRFSCSVSVLLSPIDRSCIGQL